jgi:hypothetical protein
LGIIFGLVPLLATSCGRTADPLPVALIDIEPCLMGLWLIDQWHVEDDKLSGYCSERTRGKVFFQANLYSDGSLRDFNFDLGELGNAEGEFSYSDQGRTGEIRIYYYSLAGCLELTERFTFHPQSDAVQIQYLEGSPVSRSLLDRSLVKYQTVLRRREEKAKVRAALENLPKSAPKKVNATLSVKIPNLAIDWLLFELICNGVHFDAGTGLLIRRPVLLIHTELPPGPCTVNYRQDESQEWLSAEVIIPPEGGRISVE